GLTLFLQISQSLWIFYPSLSRHRSEYPGFISPIPLQLSHSLSSLGLSDAQAESVTRSINQRLVDGSFLSPGEIVDVVMFLLSSKSAGLYGQELIVDKGYGLR
ncbi:SDR family oxidoreductase, partial [Pseudomonas aeruginosa]|uniref:SDR family oxidoreductase n=1 Tax=Pseudomonas aeruginosa TaxID=287 RepID=UPI001FCEA3A0